MAVATQITTGKVRFSYVHVFEPRSVGENDKPKYSVTLLIPKEDKATMAKIKAAIEVAKANWSSAHNGAPAPQKTVLHDGDGTRSSDGQPFGTECKGHYVLTASSARKPVIVYPDKTPLTEPTELYSGCYGKAIINFYCYEVPGNKGISAGLNGIMFLDDGEPLAGGVISDDDWDDEEDDLL